MTIAVGAANAILGWIYFQYGTMTAVEMVRNRRRMGFSHFGAAWIAMAFTCGPHHFVHGLHALGGGAVAPLDLVTVAVGAPAGLTWFLLRLEAFRGGRGDRFVPGSPLWVLALPTAGAAYVTALVAAAIPLAAAHWDRLGAVAPNMALLVIYLTIGYYLARTQIANRRPLGGWSVSGLSLAVIFPTCAVMHAVFAYTTLAGRTSATGPLAAIDWLAVPAGLYFLWVVHALSRGRVLDWNRRSALHAEAAS